MKIFIEYIGKRKFALLLLILCSAIFAAVFSLYKLPAAVVGYAAALSGVLLLACGVLDFIRFVKIRRRLDELSHLSASMIDSLPRPDGIFDGEYQCIINNLRDECIDLAQKASSRRIDTVDYYTAWVHQIKTPIASMRLTLQNEDSPLSRRLSADLRKIEQYVDMALAFLRLDSPSSDYVFKKCGVDSVIRESVKKFASEFIDRKLSLDYPGTDIKAITDEKWLAFLIEQILSNALKYTPAGGIKIHVDEPCVIVIEDSGIGIAPEDLPRVFEKGYTGCNGRTDKRASGLGLYLCKRVCSEIGAKISIRSEVDRGTSVYISLEKNSLVAE